MKEALIWSGVWVTLALVFNAGVWYYKGEQAGLEFLTGYLLEKSLSVDNIFIFVLIFGFFKVPPHLQHRVLFWGVLGALVMRGIFIALGAVLIAKFHWIIYIFGAFLVWTGWRMFKQKNEDIHPEDNPLVRWAKKVFPVSPSFQGDKFFFREGRKWVATPLFLCLLSVEFTDLIFAVDSIPAIFAITSDPFIVFTSNVFAILGLRSLYFALESIIAKFPYLKYGLALVLVFIGLKMLTMDFFKIPVVVSLGIIAAVLATSILLNVWKNKKEAAINKLSNS
jgi:tellurite resistance protein TerC